MLPEFAMDYGTLRNGEHNFSAAEVAAILDVNVDQVYALIQAEQRQPGTGLRAFNVSTGSKPNWRIKSSVIDAFESRASACLVAVPSPAPTPAKKPKPLKAQKSIPGEGFAARYRARKAAAQP